MNPGDPQPKTGTLYCLPTPLGEGSFASDVLPTPVLRIVADLQCFVAENARSARAFLKQIPSRHPLQSIDIQELNEHTRDDQLQPLLAPLLAGRDVGLVSEAGCPGVADPGAALIALAHRHGVRVVPMVGPSAILLALMASGMNGQQFAFVGYIPAPPAERQQRLRELEARSGADNETILLIETPYRAQALFDAAIATLRPGTLLSVAAELTLPAERVRCASVENWRRAPLVLGKVPAVFALLAEKSAGRPGQLSRGPAPRRGAPGPGPRNGGRPPRT